MPKSRNNSRRSSEAGYTLLMVVFLVATMLIFAAAAAPSILTNGRRERETEMVWRGQQYQRAIGMYFRAFGKYPTKIEDLTKQTNGVRFLRQAYTDPANKEDGSWRFIYVGPNGQLIGSLHNSSLLQNAVSGQMQSLVTPPISGAQQGGASAAPGAAGAPGQSSQQTNSAMTPNPLTAQPQGMEGTVLGGNIIGVGSKVKQPSLRVYLGATTYREWEFIFNPLQQAGASGQPAPVNPNATPGVQTPAQGATGAPSTTIPPPTGQQQQAPTGQ